MTNETESRNSLVENRVGANDRGTDTILGARPASEEASRIRPAQNISKPVPFNGLLTNKLLTELAGEDFARLLPFLEPVSLACGEDLYGYGESVKFVYFPETVVLSHLHLLSDGCTVEAALIGKEGLAGLSAIFNTPRPAYWTQVVLAGSALRVKAEVIREEFLRGTGMQQVLLAYASTRIAQLSQRAVCNGRHLVEERLCSWLLMIHDRVGDNELPLTHEQMARHLGTRRAGITCVATSLRDKGIISYKRGHLRILDRQLLEAAACECYRALNRQKLAASKL
jgi:CRP-like cAMP-binding protein